MLNLVHVRTFPSVSETGGIRAAGRCLGVSPATVVDHLDRLERDLGARLLIRRRPAVTLTREGARFAPLARALIATAERARAVVAGGPVRIAAATNIGAYMLPPELARFRARTGAPVELWIGPNPEVAERLATGEADIAAMEWWDGRPDFRAHPWRSEPLVAIAAPRHAWARLEAVPLAALLAEPVLGGERGSGTGTVLRAVYGDAVERLRMVEGFGGTEAVKRGVRAGLGVSIVLAGTVQDEAASGALVVRPLAGGPVAKDLVLVTPARADAGSEPARLARFLLTGEAEGEPGRPPDRLPG